MAAKDSAGNELEPGDKVTVELEVVALGMQGQTPTVHLHAPEPHHSKLRLSQIILPAELVTAVEAPAPAKGPATPPAAPAGNKG